ncbi:hypothetical protein KC332_g14583 [Hortaea werneckii]|nr:hypothetical protein KC358_g14623 [Hortaea werneckii]KAI6805878.1 hypothetical protein KC350_g14401 [Hortaea werneckii]KAI6905931.1 hypothetical protein KC348_g14822 [Hortaea werneckii]KAI6923901.1 hypothetical protein KC341_g14406 [Hortaea werneckii]KAI6957517.1 hypothetical protein KC321_g14547 [Hortaea werneckii]
MDASPLAKLPAELRNNIYHNVLLQEDNIKLSFQPAGNNQKSRVVLCTRRQNEFLALTLTCKALRRETHELFFAMNSFEIDANVSNVSNARSGTASMPILRFLDGVTTLSARSAIKSIALNIGLQFPSRNDRRVLGAIKGFKRHLFTTYPCLPLKLKASLYCHADDEKVELELDMQNLGASVAGVLEQVMEVEQEILNKIDGDDRDSEDDEADEAEINERNLGLHQLEVFREELHRCLQYQAGA